MSITIHQIHFDLSDPKFPEVVFRGGYRPGAGPLPTLHYALQGLWTLDDLVIKAFFEATKVPTHEGELILHRYESPRVTHQGQAAYRYFTIPGMAGMILSQPGYKDARLRVIEAFHHLDKTTNWAKCNAWLESLPEERIGDIRIEEVRDQFGGAPVLLAIDEAPIPEPPPKPTPTPERDPNAGFTGNPDIDDELPF